MHNFRKTLTCALMAAAASVAVVPAAQAQVAGIGVVNKIKVIMGAKAFKDGYTGVEKQYGPQIARLDQLQREIAALSKPFDTDGDGDLSQADTAWVNALKDRETVIKSLDKNKDNNLTGTELDDLRARNLPSQQIIEKQNESGAIQQDVQLAQLYVVDSINKQYNNALKSVVATKKINAVFAPGALEYGPPEIDITSQVVAALDRAIPAVALPAPEKFSTSQEAINLREQIERIMVAGVIAQARAQQAAQQQGQPQAGQPAPQQPAPPPAGTQEPR